MTSLRFECSNAHDSALWRQQQQQAADAAKKSGTARKQRFALSHVPMSWDSGDDNSDEDERSSLHFVLGMKDGSGAHAAQKAEQQQQQKTSTTSSKPGRTTMSMIGAGTDMIEFDDGYFDEDGNFLNEEMEAKYREKNRSLRRHHRAKYDRHKKIAPKITDDSSQVHVPKRLLKGDVEDPQVETSSTMSSRIRKEAQKGKTPRRCMVDNNGGRNAELRQEQIEKALGITKGDNNKHASAIVGLRDLKKLEEELAKKEKGTPKSAGRATSTTPRSTCASGVSNSGSSLFSQSPLPPGGRNKEGEQGSSSVSTSSSRRSHNTLPSIHTPRTSHASSKKTSSTTLQQVDDKLTTIERLYSNQQREEEALKAELSEIKKMLLEQQKI